MVRTAYNRIRGDSEVRIINVAIHKCIDSKGFWAESLNIPGAFTQGNTIAETENQMFEAVSLLLEDDYPEITDYTLEFEVRDA